MTEGVRTATDPTQGRGCGSGEVLFRAGLATPTVVYALLLGGMLVADTAYTTPAHLLGSLRSPEIRYSLQLSLVSCTLTSILSLWVAVPSGYWMSRASFPGKRWMDALLDTPIVLPPLVLGLSLLILFQTAPGKLIERVLPVTYSVAGVVLAQFMVASAFAIRTMRVTFEQIPARREQVALTLGCSRAQAFWLIALPQARRGMVTAFALAWARSLGEFGPILVFAGATRFKTEVLPTTVFLELSTGNLEAAVAVSLLMVAAAMGMLTLLRVFGSGTTAAGPV